MGFAPKGGATARKEWYDRNPIIRSMDFTSVGVAPHGDTIRASWTVATGKKAFIVSVHAGVTRQTAATTAGIFRAYVKVVGVRALDALESGNTVGDGGFGGVGYSGFAMAGDVIELHTADSSTGGTCAYSVGGSVVEFDA